MTIETSVTTQDIELTDGEVEVLTDPHSPAVSPAADESPEASGSNRLASGVSGMLRNLIPPILGILGFIGLWALIAPRIDTRVGSLPGPVEVLDAGRDLYNEWLANRASRAEFFEAQDARNAEFMAAGTPELVQDFAFNGPPSFPAQIWTSVQTVALGFVIGTAIAIPVGLLSGLSSTFQRAINPLVQIFKPVSPLAWLPIVTIVISAAALDPDSYFAPAFVISALVVTLNSLWPTLINTSVGASSVDKDLINVGKVLKLGWFARLRKLILPSALPFIFTGMRLSLGVGWMVLIAAEMLAQNPGLGKFIWDEFQNGSSQSLARIMFAVFVIGFIGFLLDRLMSMAESFVSRNWAA